MKKLVLALCFSTVALYVIGCKSEEPNPTVTTQPITSPPTKGEVKPTGMVPDTKDDPRDDGK